MNVAARAYSYLQKLPPAIAGAGGHDATFRAASVLVHGFQLGEAEALVVLRLWNQSHCAPPWTEAELRHKVLSALAKPSDRPVGYLLGGGARPHLPLHHAPPVSVVPPWPVRDQDALRAILRAGGGLVDLFERSPYDPEGMDAEAFIDALFPGDPWLCCGIDQRRAITDRREAFRGRLGGLQFIVPSPMTGPSGKNQEGNPSPRCLGNTGPREFLVVECDFGPADVAGGEATVADLCAGVLLHLATFAPLVMAVHSGGKSIHGWFTCEGRPEGKLRRFMRYAVACGADRATWTRCQFVRMPEGRRATGARQAVQYWNPTLLTR